MIPDAFSVVELDCERPLQSRSLASGVAAAAAAGARAVLIALADMPLVPTRHFAALAARFDGDRIATSVAGTVTPPAIFGSSHFGALRFLEGDKGARSLLEGAPVVALEEIDAIDIDLPEDMQRAERIMRGAGSS